MFLEHRAREKQGDLQKGGRSVCLSLINEQWAGEAQPHACWVSTHEFVEDAVHIIPIFEGQGWKWKIVMRRRMQQLK